MSNLPFSIKKLKEQFKLSKLRKLFSRPRKARHPYRRSLIANSKKRRTRCYRV